ncbi:hypothetical protein BTHER_06220 [Brochothrix thermosphacta DSM 20171 = FSL F6-1036]|nr:hypothetical protein BTHER_06220 [Brochothrix thermosphacta DSM 20171 = FSL F6-1036]
MTQGAIHHIEIYVADLAESENFLGLVARKFGLYAYQKWDKGISWQLKGQYLVFVQAESQFTESGYHRKRIGLNHLAFNVESSANVDDYKVKLEERGSRILYLDKHPYAGGSENYAIYFEDPNGIKVELVATRAKNENEGCD